MSILFFMLFFLLGFLLNFVANIIGIVQGFQEGVGWGLICWFVPFGGLVFLIQFWNRRQWLRHAFWMHLVAFGLIFISIIIVALDPKAFDSADESSPSSSEVTPEPQPWLTDTK
jgi:peptidoglycan/LPS O-acetylase OafA/YrhL